MNEPETSLAPVPVFALRLNDEVLRPLASCLRLLLRAALVFIFIGFLIAVVPLEPWKAIWYLNIGQVSYDYGVVFLFAFAMALLAEFFEPDVQRALLRRNRLLAVANLGVVLFALLVPLQMFSYGQVWMDSRDQTRLSIGALHARTSKVREQISQARSVSALNAALADTEFTAPLELQGMTLAEQQRRLIEAIALQQKQLDLTVQSDQQEKLLVLFARTFKGVLASGLLALTFLSCRRWLAG
jgi:hypothetical protein